MKRLLFIVLAMIATITSFAQQKDVTSFLGIPVDGTASSMKQKLVSKGFVPKKVGTNEFLEGEFNGTDVHVWIATNNNKVYRIMLCDKNTVDETQIKIRFNNLVKQFENNKRYHAFADYSLSDKEDISYEMGINNKEYVAYYLQDPDFENIDAKIQIVPIRNIYPAFSRVFHFLVDSQINKSSSPSVRQCIRECSKYPVSCRIILNPRKRLQLLS